MDTGNGPGAGFQKPVHTHLGEPTLSSSWGSRKHGSFAGCLLEKMSPFLGRVAWLGQSRWKAWHAASGVGLALPESEVRTELVQVQQKVHPGGGGWVDGAPGHHLSAFPGA